MGNVNPNNNNDDKNKDENQDSPFGFLQDMFSQIFSGPNKGEGPAGIFNMFGLGNSKPDPIKIAKYFASEIAAKESL